MTYDKTAQAMLHLIRCALQGEPPKPLDEIDYAQLYQLSAFHSVEAMVAMALESGDLLTEEYADPACIKQWKDAKVKAIRKVILLDTEREEIFRYFEEQGIWYLPLKGILLKELYPKLGMRQMADNDILFDKTYQHQLKEYMENRGYQTESFQRGNHDVYQKAPVYNFEFHTALFSEGLYSRWEGSSETLRKKLKKDPENCFGCHFSDEDFYVHLLLHGHKHYTNAGTGIRFLVDVFVFISKKQQALDWEYINQELAVLNMQTFESNARVLAQKLFDKNASFSLTEVEQELLNSFIYSGTYGTVSLWTQNAVHSVQKEHNLSKSKAKIFYFWKRVFPDKEYIFYRYPFCRKHPWSLPLGWFLRLISAAFSNGKQIRNEIKELKKIK